MRRGSSVRPRPLACRRSPQLTPRGMKPKRSAESVAALRFAASFEDDPAVRGPDHIAGSLLSWHLRTIGRTAVLRDPVLRHYHHALPGIYEYHILRTGYVDHIVNREVADGAEQVVILGAGFDTRALWMQDALGLTRVLEVDHPRDLPAETASAGASRRPAAESVVRRGGLRERRGQVSAPRRRLPNELTLGLRLGRRINVPERSRCDCVTRPIRDSRARQRHRL